MFLNRPGASYAKAVVLDLVNPARSGRRMLDWPRQAGLKTRRGPIGLQSASELTRNRHRVECRADAARVESAPAFRQPRIVGERRRAIPATATTARRRRGLTW